MLKAVFVFQVIMRLINCLSDLDNLTDEATILERFGGNISKAVIDITHGFPADHLTIAVDNHTDINGINCIAKELNRADIAVRLFNITEYNQQQKFLKVLLELMSQNFAINNLFFCTHRLAEHMLIELRENNVIRRNILHMFYWGRQPLNLYFIRSMHRAMKTVVITNPRNGTYRLYFNQASAHRSRRLTMKNWWSETSGLFNRPTLPPATEIYKDFKGKEFYIPVVHKPPWHFVQYHNDSVEVTGGRDDELLALLAAKLNFRYTYFDPPDRTQGSSISKNGSFEGILGLIWRREAEFFLGDVAITLDRSYVVEFSFLTLADSGAFVTHAPGRLNEALALVRPFHWQVWPLVILTLILSGPILYLLIALPDKWNLRPIIKSHSKLLMECVWFTTTIFLRQTGRQPADSHKSRMFIIILSIAATYVIGDMYSANLTSLLARPGREKPISNLAELEVAMKTHGYQLYVEKHSSTYSILENGTGVYERLWKMMNKQRSHTLTSVENGVKLVRNSRNVAVIAGRETLFFDIQRFGSKNFHLSDKLNTAYSAIAMQQGCPYRENINKILMAIFEAGILTKMTESEYEKLGKQQAEVKVSVIEDTSDATSISDRQKLTEDNDKSQTITIKMLQGAFYILLIGHGVSGMVLLFELIYKKHSRKVKRTRKKKCVWLKKIKLMICRFIKNLRARLRRRMENILHEAMVATLEYIE